MDDEGWYVEGVAGGDLKPVMCNSVSASSTNFAMMKVPLSASIGSPGARTHDALLLHVQHEYR